MYDANNERWVNNSLTLTIIYSDHNIQESQSKISIKVNNTVAQNVSNYKRTKNKHQNSGVYFLKCTSLDQIYLGQAIGDRFK
jgi:hypothetical protein